VAYFRYVAALEDVRSVAGNTVEWSYGAIGPERRDRGRPHDV